MVENNDPVINAIERLSQIRETDLGQTLLERPRYGHFRPHDVSIQDWLDLFDDDINNFEHNGLTAHIADIVTSIDGVSPQVRNAVILTASIHDLPEDITGSKSGDKQYNISGKEDEKRERARLRELAADPDFPLTEEEVELSIEVMKDSKRKPPETEPGFLFNIVERVGYIRTALIAWDLYQTGKIAPHNQPNIEWMIGNILANHLPYMQSITHLSKSVDTQLRDNYKKLNQMVETLGQKRVQLDVWDICGTTGTGESRLDPDVQLSQIRECVASWRVFVTQF